MAPFDPDLVLMITGLGIVCATIVAVRVATLRRQRSDALPPAELREIREHLNRLEQAVDAIALETERIAEGQRFTTKILAEATRVPLAPDHGKLPAS